jgi:HTH-type transcriptional regulator, sugar sensing transcriptional regulator
MPDINNKLKSLGLSPKEASVYLALLKIGSGTVMDISYKSGVNRCTIYDILESLNQRGLISQTYKGKKRIFIVQHPESLNNVPRQALETIGNIMPDLNALYNKATYKPRIEYYEGYEGIIYANDHLLKNTEKDYYYFGSVEEMTRLIGHQYLEKYVKKRVKLGIWSNAIRVRSKETSLPFMAGDKKNLRRVKYFPKAINEDVAALYISDRHITIISSFNEGYSIIIESPELIALMKTMWNMMWSMADD